MDRNYRKEYSDRTQAQKDNRTPRRQARTAAGLKPGDPREVDHVRPLSKGGSNGPANTRVVSRTVNRQKGDGSRSSALRAAGVNLG